MMGAERAVPGGLSFRRALPALVLAAVLLPFANGRNTIAVAAWLAPLFLLRFVRSQRAGRGLFIAWVVLSAAWSFQFRGMAPLPGILYFVLAAVYGLVGVFPFIFDRYLAPRFDGFTATFVLPCAWVGMEYLVAEFTPYGSWNSAAYTQYENLTLIQIASVTGLYGVTFLIAWFAAVCNWAWELEFTWPRLRGGILAFATVVAIVLGYGGARLALFPPAGSTVRVASLTKMDAMLFSTPEAERRAYTGELTGDEYEVVRRRGNEINANLFRRAEAEARAGAKIVFWGEGNAFSFKEDEPALIQRGVDLAREHRIYLGIAVATWNSESERPLENKLVLIDPEGDVGFEFWKARPVPGGEAAISAVDDGRIKSVETPYGRLGAVICFDMDFPGLLDQAGRQGVDIMLVPSNDWKAIDPWHTHMARFRAVEQGFNMVRHVSQGLSLASDYQGRALDSMDHYTSTDRVLIARVPTEGVRTIYATVGDSFAWLCIAGLLASIAVSWRRR